jgi:hypothetical protein
LNVAKQPAKGRTTTAKSSTAKTAAKPAPQIIDAEIVAEVSAEKVEAKKPEPVKVESAKSDAPNPKAETPKVEKTAKDSVLEPQQNASAMPAILGGLVAGAIGFAAAYMVLPKGDTSLAAQVSAQSTEISGLRDQIAAIPSVDLSGVEAAQAEAATAVADLDGRITGLETRLDDLSSRAGAEGSLSTAAYEQEMDALRADLAAMRGSVQAELESARAQAASIQENADAAARNAAGRAALARVEGGLETGAPLGAALDDLAAAMQADVPDALTAVRDGAPTLASLQASFPDAARAALATARAEGASGEAEGGFTAFLRNQLDVRSVAPKEGNDADAVLSRAQAAINEGRLSDTLAELGALPEVARAELTEWQGLAEARADALAAAATLSTSLNDN